jgi:hypothetical protein
LVISLFGFRSVAAASPKAGDIPRSECAVVFERFGQIRPPADAKAVAYALKDIRWLARAAVDQVTFMAGWIPMSHSLGPPGALFVIGLRPAVSHKDIGYRIYLHTTRTFSGDAATGLRAFLAGRAGPDVFVDEYTLCYPDGRILGVDAKSRKSFRL